MSKPQAESGSRKRELFLKALEKGSPQERAAFLDVTCGEDAELRAGIDALFCVVIGTTASWNKRPWRSTLRTLP